MMPVAALPIAALAGLMVIAGLTLAGVRTVLKWRRVARDIAARRAHR